MFHKICFSDLPLPPLLHPPYNYSFNSITPSPFSPRQFPSSSFQPMAEPMPLKTISNLNSSSNSRGARRDALERKRKKLFASRTEQRQAPHQEAHQDLGDPRQVQEGEGEGEGEVGLSPREIQKYLDGTQAKEMELFLSCDDGHKGFANVRIGILGGEED